ncbi:thiamine-phosphate kinase [candidate division KSB1 bacterium]|nr:thiamine-phosphate kinase [candidate division KSB1 bacterium]
MDLKSTGEFGMIERIQAMLAGSDADIPLSIGDDAAVLNSKLGYQTVVTTDALIEGIHFDLRYTPLEDLGWKALAVNLSDLAAMAADPTGAVISLALPTDWSSDQVEQLYQGLKACSETYQCPIIGGDTTGSPGPAMLSLTVLGEVQKDRYITRSGAKPGDFVCVSGDLGGSLTGFEALHSGPPGIVRTPAIDKLLRPFPRLQIAKELFTTLSLHAMIDISDGLGSEIHHICSKSKMGCLIEADKIPIHPEAKALSEQIGQDVIEMAMTSGEEYELLFTLSAGDLENFQNMKMDVPCHIIGEMKEASSGIKINRDGQIESIKANGWDHFKK